MPEAVDFVDAVTARQPVGFYRPAGAAAWSIRALTQELLGRLAAAVPRAAPTAS